MRFLVYVNLAGIVLNGLVTNVLGVVAGLVGLLGCVGYLVSHPTT